MNYTFFPFITKGKAHKLGVSPGRILNVSFCLLLQRMLLLLYCFKVYGTVLVTIQSHLLFVGSTVVGQIKCPRLLQISELESRPSVSHRKI